MTGSDPDRSALKTNMMRVAVTTRAFLSLAWNAQKLCLVGLIGMEVLQGLLPLAAAWFSKLLFDVLSNTPRREIDFRLLAHVGTILGFQAGLALLGQLQAPIGSLLGTELGRKLSLSLQTEVFTKVNEQVGIRHFESGDLYDTISLISRGAQTGPMQSLRLVATSIRGAVTLAGFIGALASLNPLLIILVFLATAPLLSSQLAIGRQKYQVAVENSPIERRAQYLAEVLTSPHYAKEIRLYGTFPYLLRVFRGHQERIHQRQLRQGIRETRERLGHGAISTIIASCSHAVVVFQTVTGTLSLGDLAFYLGAAGSVQSSLSSVANVYSGLAEAILYYTHYGKLESMQLSGTPSTGAKPIKTPRKGIEFEDVSFRYTDDQPWVLRGLSLFLPAGQRTALVGTNGSGKTTIVKLLTRMYDPDEGRILWDGIDIREFDPEELRRRIGVLFQDFVRYELSAQENIGLGNTDRLHELEDIRAAAIRAGIDERIRRLSNDYSTILSRALSPNGSGVDLSGGEWQKLALARLFMREAELVILDEPTAMLDALSESGSSTELAKLTRSATTLLISHRFSTVRLAHRIAVLDRGRIVEAGVHDSLIRVGGIYASMHALQSET